MSANYGDYPALYILELSYDGDRFILRTESDVKVYEHLMMYLSSGTPLAGNSEHKQVIHYVLTHDTTHTWEELWGSLASSVLGAVIDHSCSSFSKQEISTAGRNAILPSSTISKIYGINSLEVVKATAKALIGTAQEK